MQKIFNKGHRYQKGKDLKKGLHHTFCMICKP